MPQGLDLVSSLEASVRTHGERPAFGVRATDGWRWTTYADFGRMLDAFRASLADRGIAAGDRVAVKVLPLNYEVRTLAFLPWAHVFGFRSP